ncbi:MAG: hypothetical protein IT385_11765 [Deltaproteobacteria bacterium]|nr:hypothetical protein [Deltaproteobacteria bacterium]
MSATSRRVHLLVLLGALAACEPPAGKDASEERLAPAGADGLVVPPARDEVTLTATDEADDLFPALAGDDLVWVRVEPDREVARGDQEIDCFACVGCSTCRWSVMHRRLPDGEERVVWSGRWVAGAPTVDDGLVTFIDGDNVVRLVDLASLATERIHPPSYLGRGPLVREGLVWWYAWDGHVGGQAMVAWDPTLPGVVTRVRADANEMSFVPNGTVGAVGRRQPFALDGARLVWASHTTGGGVVNVADLGTGDRSEALVDAQRAHLTPLVVGDTIVTLAYDLADSCYEARCELSLERIQGGAATPLAPDAQPTVYLPPVSDGRRVAWVDRRDGPYMIVGVDVAAGGDERRLSSEDARVGVVSRLAFDDGRLVWSDRRTGRWRLVMRRW